MELVSLYVVPYTSIWHNANFFLYQVLPSNQSSPYDGWLFIEVVVTVPEVGWDPLRIKSFETDLPQFQHSLDSTADFVEFDKLSLRSSNALIQAKVSQVYIFYHKTN